MRLLFYSCSFLLALAFNLTNELTEAVFSQTSTFTYNEITYIVNFKKNRGQEIAFSLSYPDKRENIHHVEYKGTCGADTIGVLGETVVNPQGQTLSSNTAVQAIIFDISSSSDWEMSGAIRQALELMCSAMNE